MADRASNGLNRAAAMPMAAYDPGLVISAVNALRALGKDVALARVQACAEVADATVGLLWVLRVLFEMPAHTEFPPARIGMSAIPPPADPAKLPRFPIVMAHFVPLLPVDRYVLGGKAEPVQAHIACYRAHGMLRAQPLPPPAAPARIEAAFLRIWREEYGDAHVATVLNTVSAQIGRLGRSAA